MITTLQLLKMQRKPKQQHHNDHARLSHYFTIVVSMFLVKITWIIIIGNTYSDVWSHLRSNLCFLFFDLIVGTFWILSMVCIKCINIICCVFCWRQLYINRNVTSWLNCGIWCIDIINTFICMCKTLLCSHDGTTAT